MSEQHRVGRSENSRLAFEAIVTHGLLRRAHMAIYRFIYEHGPITRNKLDAALCPGKANPWPSRRLVEMERMKVLAVVGQDDTGPHRMDIWDVTDRMPEGTPRRETLRDTLRGLVLGLEEVVDSPGAVVDGWRLSGEEAQGPGRAAEAGCRDEEGEGQEAGAAEAVRPGSRGRSV